MISSDKNLPKYIHKFNIAFICFFAVWFTAGTALMVTIGCIYGESVITYAIIASTFAVAIIGAIILWRVEIKLRNRLIDERTAELEKQFPEMPFEDAERILKEKGIITDKGFIVKDGAAVPFEKAWLDLYYGLVASAKIDICVFENDGSLKKLAQYRLDGALYNFLINKDTGIKNNYVFNLLVKDKKEFAKLALKYFRTLRWGFGSFFH